MWTNGSSQSHFGKYVALYVCGDKQQNWKIALPQVKFAYNRMVNQFTSKTPFKIVCAYSPHHVYDLVVMPTIVGGSKTTKNMVEKSLQIYAKARAHFEATNAKYKLMQQASQENVSGR